MLVDIVAIETLFSIITQIFQVIIIGDVALSPLDPSCVGAFTTIKGVSLAFCVLYFVHRNLHVNLNDINILSYYAKVLEKHPRMGCD